MRFSRRRAKLESYFCVSWQSFFEKSCCYLKIKRLRQYSSVPKTNFKSTKSWREIRKTVSRPWPDEMIQTEKLRRNGARPFLNGRTQEQHTTILGSFVHILRPLSYWMGKYCLRRQDLYETSLPSFPELCMWEPQQQQPWKETNKTDPSCCLFHTHSRPKSLLPLPSHCVCVCPPGRRFRHKKKKGIFLFLKKYFRCVSK